jgi:hypothetical protein
MDASSVVQYTTPMVSNSTKDTNVSTNTNANSNAGVAAVQQPVYYEKMLIMQDELSREYLVRDINLEENRILLQNRLSNEMKIIRYRVREKEKAFLKNFVRKTVDSQEVA